MSDLRATVDSTQVLALLKQHFSVPVTDLTHVEGGLVSRTFSFRAGEQEYIVRFNKDNMMTSNLPKEAYLYPMLTAAHIPMPQIVQVGRLGTLHFAISHKAPGKMLEQHSAQEVMALMPQLIELLDAIHHVDISATQGYGCFSETGRASATSWRDALLRIGAEEDERDYFGKWHYLFDDTFLERDLFTKLYRHMEKLLDFFPAERYLVYGGASLKNILAQDGRITAALDWVDARYGDFVYDIATLAFWCPWLHVPERFQQYYQERRVEVPFYEQRLLCYYCYIALDAMRFYAMSGNEDAYQWLRQGILQKLAAEPGWS